MELLGVGTDIVSMKRVAEAPNLRRAAEFVLLPHEIAQMEAHTDPVQFFASRFAAKEAVIKACPDALNYHDFAILKADEKPIVQFIRNAAYTVMVSISHEPDYAVGVAMCCC